MSNGVTAQGNERTWKCALYLRLSKEDGDKAESDSITNQRELVTNYIKTVPNITIVSERVDDGFSGATFQRPAFIAMMDDIKAGRIDCVAVKDLSRFGRNYTEAGRYLENVFPFMNVRFIAVNDSIDSNAKKSYGDNIIIPFKNLMNDAYCRDISVKIRSQLEVKRKNGDFIGAFAVYGYTKTIGDNKKKGLVVDEFAAEVVRDIFKWKIEGMSQQRIADRLNELGVLSPYEYKRSLGLRFSTSFKQGVQARWSAVAVGRILKDETYIGTLAQGKTSTPNHKVKKIHHKPKEDWVRSFDRHEPIISRDDFELANSLLLKDMRVSPSESAVYLFSGMLKCADCNESMVRKTVPSGGKKYFYYVCGNSKKGLCKTHSASESNLTEAVTASLQAHIDYILDVERILTFIDTLPLKRDEVQKLNKHIVSKKEDIERIKSRKVSLYESLEGGIIDKQEYTELRERYNTQLDEAERALLALGAEIDSFLACKGEKNFWIEQFKAHRNFSELTRKIVVSLIDGIDVFEGNRVNIRFKYRANLEAAISFINTVDKIIPLDDTELIKEAV
ncbi:MAG TPA: recombinase [Ruminococcaceae bacterium]|nr:recombinase [Oscillospiraceae bacterium]